MHPLVGVVLACCPSRVRCFTARTRTLDKRTRAQQRSGPAFVRPLRLPPNPLPQQFGVLLWEIYTAAHAFKGVPRALLGHQVTQLNRRPDFPQGTPRAYAELAERCWQAKAENRCGRRRAETAAARKSCARVATYQLLGSAAGTCHTRFFAHLNLPAPPPILAFARASQPSGPCCWQRKTLYSANAAAGPRWRRFPSC